MILLRWQRYALSLLSGILMVLSFPYTGSLYPLIFIAWVPLLILEHHVFLKKDKSSRVLWHAYITFFIYNLGASYWIFYSKGGEVAAVLAYLLNGFLMALIFFIFHKFKKIVGQKWGQFALLFCWLAFEYIHFHWELSWPWLNMGNIFANAPEFVQWYQFTGILGGTLWILLANMILFIPISKYVFHRKYGKSSLLFLTGFLIIVIIPSIISYKMYQNYLGTKNPIQIVVTQPNIDPYKVKFSTPIIYQLKQFVEPTRRLLTDSTQIILAPETAIPATFLENQYQESRGMQYLTQNLSNWGNTALLVGASTQRVFDRYNSVASQPIPKTNLYFENYNSAVLMKSGQVPEFVHKSKLVLGVEKIPFTKWLPFLEKLSIQNGGTSGTLGIEKVPKVMQVNGFTFAPVVCYGSIYGNYVATQCRKGAEVIFVITNDGWWGESAGYKQHAAFCRLRAIETRRYVAQSANTGISCIVNQRGDVIKATDYWVRDAFRATVQLNDAKTFYVRHGDWIGYYFLYIFSGILFVTVLFPIVRGIAKRN